MKRRTIAKLAGAIASLFAAPRVISSPAGEARDMAHPVTVTTVRVGLRDTKERRDQNRLALAAGKPQPWPDPPDDENNYWAEVIKDGDQYFYRVGETAVEISAFEYGYVQANPNLYYFSQTLKVLVRLLRARQGPAAQVRVADFMLDIGTS